MKKIFKYPLEMEEATTKIEMPKYAEILTVQVGRDGPCLWAIVDPEEEKEEITLKIYATGEELDEEEDTLNSQRIYIGTFQQTYGEHVWHVFQII